MKQLLADISQATLNLVFPIYCRGCDVKLAYDNNAYLCQNCRSQIRLNTGPFCIRCGRQIAGAEDSEAPCGSCLDRAHHFQRAWQCCQYQGIIKELIHSFKYKKRLFLKGVLADILCDFAAAFIDCKAIDAIVATPMHRNGISKRGFNQAEVLAKGLAIKLGLPLIQGCLIKTKRTRQQAKLDKAERLKNIRGAFYARKDADLNGKKLLLVDDVFTTGATADESSKVLIKAGADSVWVLALARGV